MFNYSKLIEVLNTPPFVIALVGAGGKTNTLFALGKHYANLGYRVALSTTTKILVPEPEQVKAVVIDEDIDVSQIVSGKLVLFAKAKSEQDKLIGYEPEELDQLNISAFDVFIYEADGAKCKAIKAPREGEPRLSQNTTHVVGLVGLDVVGAYVNDDTVHRVKLFCEVTGSSENEVIKPEHIKKLVEHPRGLFKNTSDSMEKIFMMTKADDANRLLQAEKICDLLTDFKGSILWI